MRAIATLLLLQIVAPVIAPLQMLDALRDLLSPQVHRSVTQSPESTTTPTISEISGESAGVSLIAPVPSWGTSALSMPAHRSTRMPIGSPWILFSTSQVQRPILRV
jgi:hypothetical protein